MQISPEGAQRCRALASGLIGPGGGSFTALSRAPQTYGAPALKSTAPRDLTVHTAPAAPRRRVGQGASSLLQNRAEFADPALPHPCFRPLQDRHDRAAPTAWHHLGCTRR